MLINTGEIITGALVNAITATFKLLIGSLPSFRGDAVRDADIARWFNTYELSSGGPALPGISQARARRLVSILRRDDVQAALQTLLAARLAEAAQLEVTEQRAQWEATLARADPQMLRLAGGLFDYYDEKIGNLVARLEANPPPWFHEVRMAAQGFLNHTELSLIERNTALIATVSRNEEDFLAQYRRHVRELHGKLVPPDLQRRRRVPIKSIYVDTQIYEASFSKPGRGWPACTVPQLAKRIKRTVLVGDPGAGKTTAAHVLMHHLVRGKSQVPFLVTLREYAAKDPPDHSVVGHIEHMLETFYQCRAPAGLVDRLLSTGRATVIFDGLDELLDTSRRRDVATRIERFCGEYPLASVLVTSRIVGYDQARLDDEQFACYRLDGFSVEQAAQYARKWFALEEGAHAGEAEAFLAESASISDLRSNPLLLSLMCILYRGAGSLPPDRAEIYQQCADLLFHKWDEQRHIYRDLRTDRLRLVEPTMRHLAWWMFSRSEPQSAVTERDLVIQTARFLHGRGFESEDDAREAATEFVQFCRGRMWVFSDVGTTASGERLYAFTHRTFLEYFAAAHLAYQPGTPADLARTLAPHVAASEWEVVGELAIQVKDRTTDGGAEQIYARLLSEARQLIDGDREGTLLTFLARCLRSVAPWQATVRNLTRAALNYLFDSDPDQQEKSSPLRWLLVNSANWKDLIADEISARVSTMTVSADPVIRQKGLHLALCLPLISSPETPHRRIMAAGDPLADFWNQWSARQASAHATAVKIEAVRDAWLRTAALMYGLLSAEQALTMPGSLASLLEDPAPIIHDLGWPAYLPIVLSRLLLTPAYSYDPKTASSIIANAIKEFEAVGHYLKHHPHRSFSSQGMVLTDLYYTEALMASNIIRERGYAPQPPPRLDPTPYLGAAVTLCSVAEQDYLTTTEVLGPFLENLGTLDGMFPYIKCRMGKESPSALPDLPVPQDFTQVFRDWARNKVTFSYRSQPRKVT